MSQTTIERKYALTKVKPGDYILPSNDGKALWRISTYMDGPSSGLMDLPRDREFWGGWKWEPPLESWDRVDDPLAWDHWEMKLGGYDSRKSLIADVLEEPPTP